MSKSTTTSTDNDISGTFWEHLDQLRGTLVKIVASLVLFAVVAFVFKDILFEVILAPKDNSFVTYGVLDELSQKVSLLIQGDAASGLISNVATEDIAVKPFEVQLINTELTEQFMVHVKMSFYVAFLLVLPYVLFELFRFVSPALHSHEKKYVVRVVGSGFVMFMMGVALSYFVIFPLTFRFLGTYQVSDQVQNLISLGSYIDTLMMLNLMMGIVFEIPILCWLFAKLGFISASFMRRYRRHAIIILLIVAAIITPTADIFTLILVSLPMYILYEISVLIVAKTRN